MVFTNVQEKLSAVYAELGDETLKPVMWRVLVEHPVIQDVVLACKTFKALVIPTFHRIVCRLG
jgi:hypothetical protein